MGGYSQPRDKGIELVAEFSTWGRITGWLIVGVIVVAVVYLFWPRRKV
jgi:hypothetical protein